VSFFGVRGFVLVLAAVFFAQASHAAPLERRAPASPARPRRTASRSSALQNFRFERDTLAFPNWTVWNYKNGRHVVEAHDQKQKTDRYTRRCFVMSRAAQQFYKFARFEPRGRALDDQELAHRVRDVTRREPWHPALPPNQRIVFPGYANLREMSRRRQTIVQNNIGLGWPTYLRIGNFRMFSIRGADYQVKTHTLLNESLGRGEMFVAYLSDYPILHINHSVLVYQRKAGSRIDRYVCYDPNHAEAPRELVWRPDKQQFNYQKDQEFGGGYTRVYQVYGKAWQ
jgi:hypothetical protein